MSKQDTLCATRPQGPAALPTEILLPLQCKKGLSPHRPHFYAFSDDSECPWKLNQRKPPTIWWNTPNSTSNIRSLITFTVKHLEAFRSDMFLYSRFVEMQYFPNTSPPWELHGEFPSSPLLYHLCFGPDMQWNAMQPMSGAALLRPCHESPTLYLYFFFNKERELRLYHKLLAFSSVSVLQMGRWWWTEKMYL